MSIYTYKTHKTLCGVFNTEYYEDPSVSDQALDVSPEHWSEVREEIKPWNVGIPMSEEARLKSSISHKGKRSSPETEFKPGPRGFSPTKGIKIHTDENKRKLSERMKGNQYMLGRKYSLAHKQAIGDGNRGKPKPKVSCVKCHKVGGVSSMFQHFMRCF